MTDNYNFVMTLLSTIDSERGASHEIEKLSVEKCIFEAQRKKDIQSTIFVHGLIFLYPFKKVKQKSPNKSIHFFELLDLL